MEQQARVQQAGAGPLTVSHDGPGLGVWVAAGLVAAPWFWPVLAGPLSAMWVDLFAWSAGALLIGVLPTIRAHWGLAVASGWMWAAAGSSMLALLQYFNLEDGLYPYVSVTAPGIAYANVHQPNMLATLLGVGLLSVLWLVENSRLKPAVAGWFGALIVVGLAATGSRTGIVHLVLVGGLLIYWRGVSARVFSFCAAAFAVYLAAAVALPWLLEFLLDAKSGRVLLDRMAVESTCHSRVVLWSNVLHLISLKPWSGWGMDGLLYAHYITPYEGARFCEKLSNAHNLYLQLAVEYGIPAAALALCLSVWALFRLQPWRASSSAERLGWGGLLLIGFHSMVEYPLWFGVFQLMAALAVVLVWSERPRMAEPEGGHEEQPRRRPVRQWLVTALSLSVLAYVADDYYRVSQLYMPLEQRAKRYENNTFEHARKTLLFKSHVLIAQVVATPIEPENADLLLLAAQESLRIAPDSRVIRRLIETARLMGKDDIANFHEARYQSAWPDLYREWKAQEKIGARL